jgi:hypothetical protein
MYGKCYRGTTVRYVRTRAKRRRHVQQRGTAATCVCYVRHGGAPRGQTYSWAERIPGSGTGRRSCPTSSREPVRSAKHVRHHNMNPWRRDDRKCPVRRVSRAHANRHAHPNRPDDHHHANRQESLTTFTRNAAGYERKFQERDQRETP